MTPRPPRRNREQGVALVTTVIVVAVLAVVAVAMMQSTTVDRLSARSVANYTRARLAADAGLAMASAAIATNSTNDTFIVVVTTNRQLFIGNGVTNPSTSTNFAYVPMFSTVSNLSTPIAAITSGVVPITNVSGGVVFTNQLPGGLSVTSPVVSWIYMTNANGATNARFAYWVEDLGGRLDLAVVGATGAGDITNARRLTGTNPAEIALWSFFNPSSASDAGNASATALIAARSNILTTATARLVNSSVTTNMLADFAVNLRHDTNEPEVIPFGFGYADQGRPKYNLNTNITEAGAPAQPGAPNAGVSAIADAINRNLPNFKDRSGAMAPAAYVSGIAASIVDYADSNDVPTADNPNTPTYFGIENIPWPNEIFEKISYANDRSGGWLVVELDEYLEVWNMGNKPIQPGGSITVSNNRDLMLTFSNSTVATNTTIANAFKKNLKDLEYDPVDNLNIPDSPVRTFTVERAIPPNGYDILNTRQIAGVQPGGRDYRAYITNHPSWYTNQAVRQQWTIFSPSNDATTNMTIAVTYSNVGASAPVLIQRTIDGRWPRYLTQSSRLQHPDVAASSARTRYFICNNLGYASQVSLNAVPAHTGGDPRAQFFLTGALYNQNYTNGYASPGGRNVGRFQLGTYPESEVNPVKFWPDSGHATNADYGGNPTSAANQPNDYTNTVAVTAPFTNNHLMIRNDTGSYSNVVELGNIYDPMQWRDQAGSGVPNQPGLWTNLTTAATADPRFGGRNTLRVGRWEFSKFNTNGQRASQLLDLFAVGPAGGSGPVKNSIAGRININTATTNVLRALAAGVANSTDPALVPGSTNFFVPTNAVSNFITGVASRRLVRPLFSASELSTLSTNTNAASWPAAAVFGNTNLAGITEWNDSAAEEWFSRVYPLATVRSRNFLVHVVGQALQTNGTTVLSTAKKTFQIYMEPLRATSGPSAGLTTNNVPRVLATWDL